MKQDKHNISVFEFGIILVLSIIAFGLIFVAIAL